MPDVFSTLQVMPFPEEDETFVDSEAAYRTTRDYLQERSAFHKRQIYRQAFGMLRRFVKTIEVVLNGHLQQLGTGKNNDRGVPDVKMKSFVQMCVELNNESRLILALSRFSLVPRGYRRWEEGPDLVWISPMAERRCFCETNRNAVAGGKKRLKGCTLLWLCLYTFIKMPLNIRMVKHLYPKRNVFVNIFFAWARFFSQRLLAWRCLLLIITSLAYFGGHWWVYSFLLADFFCLSSSLQAVLAGVVAPARPLAMTFLGAAIITFVYGAIGMHNFREDFDSYCDKNIMARSPGLVVVQVLSYFVIFGIMLLNTIVALIVDSFQTQRRELTAREYNLETQSFISCVKRKTIETVAQASGIVDGWEYHETVCQNKWDPTGAVRGADKLARQRQFFGLLVCSSSLPPRQDYMAFIFNLFEKNAQNYTGPESQIRQFIDNADVTWLPIGRSKMLEGKSDDNKEDRTPGVNSHAAVSCEGHRQPSSEHAGQDGECAGTAQADSNRAFRKRQGRGAQHTQAAVLLCHASSAGTHDASGPTLPPAAAMAPNKDEKNLVEKLRAFQRSNQANKRCADCPERGPTYVCLDFQIFICQSCGGIHREFGHKIKSISFSEWSPAEVAKLEEGGNEAARTKWLDRWHQDTFPEPDGTDLDRFPRAAATTSAVPQAAPAAQAPSLDLLSGGDAEPTTPAPAAMPAPTAPAVAAPVAPPPAANTAQVPDLLDGGGAQVTEEPWTADFGTPVKAPDSLAGLIDLEFSSPPKAAAPKPEEERYAPRGAAAAQRG
eukprot:g31275.t1